MDGGSFITGLGLALTALAYLSLRFTTLDPQMPYAPSPWITLAAACASTLALFGTELALSKPWLDLVAYLSVTIIMSPAIVSPYRASKDEEPRWIRRYLLSRMRSQSGKLVDLVLTLGSGLLAALVISLVPGISVPTWAAGLGTAAGFSIVTRPFSIRAGLTESVPIEQASEELAGILRRKRWVAFFATLLWLFAALPILEQTYTDSFSVVAFAFALLIAFFIT